MSARLIILFLMTVETTTTFHVSGWTKAAFPENVGPICRCRSFVYRSSLLSFNYSMSLMNYSYEILASITYSVVNNEKHTDGNRGNVDSSVLLCWHYCISTYWFFEIVRVNELLQSTGIRYRFNWSGKPGLYEAYHLYLTNKLGQNDFF